MTEDFKLAQVCDKLAKAARAVEQELRINIKATVLGDTWTGLQIMLADAVKAYDSMGKNSED